jgi:hypothetical protein
LPIRGSARIEKIPADKRTREDQDVLRASTAYLKDWNREIGTVVGERIPAGDYEFFNQLADAIKGTSKKEQPID